MLPQCLTFVTIKLEIGVSHPYKSDCHDRSTGRLVWKLLQYCEQIHSLYSVSGSVQSIISVIEYIQVAAIEGPQFCNCVSKVQLVHRNRIKYQGFISLLFLTGN